MRGDQGATLKNLHLVGQCVHLDDPLSGRVGNAVKIAADAHHALMRNAPFQLEERAEGQERQRFEMRLLFSEGLIDHALRGGMHARIGNRVEPMPQLGIEIVRSERKGKSGNVLRCGFSSAKASLTTRCVVACTRGLATVSSQCRNWALRSSRLRNERARKRSPRGCSGRVSRLCPWSWPGRDGKPSAGSRSGGRSQ